MTDRYVLESMDGLGRWFIISGHHTSGDAQSRMSGQRVFFPRTAFRVTETASRRLIVLHDPNAEAK